MQRTKKRILAAAAAACLALPLLGACTQATYVTSIVKSGTNDEGTLYTITYSDGSTDTLTVSDGKDADILSVYEAYLQETGEEVSFSEFLQTYLTLTTDTSSAINESLLSVGKIYAESVETQQGMGFDPSTARPTLTEISDIAVSTGAAVIYRMDGDTAYLVTDYHVIYNNDADAEKNGGSKIARSIHAYLYGSEGAPSAVDKDGDGQADTDKDGYTVYEYGGQAIELTYVGGSITYDIAVLRADAADIRAVNPDAKAVTLADDYYVGETAIAIGNPEGDGLSVTQGIISTESEYINLQIDDTVRSYRSVRIDTALYSGNSGGGLFNKEGELIGITNAGNKTDQNINYAVPLEVVRGTADCIIENASHNVTRLTFGITVKTQNSQYVYDASLGYGSIREEVIVDTVTDNSLAGSLGLQKDDRIVSVTLNGTTYSVDRSFDIESVSFLVRSGDAVSVTYERGGAHQSSSLHTVSASDLSAVA